MSCHVAAADSNARKCHWLWLLLVPALGGQCRARLLSCRVSALRCWIETFPLAGAAGGASLVSACSVGEAWGVFSCSEMGADLLCRTSASLLLCEILLAL